PNCYSSGAISNETNRKPIRLQVATTTRKPPASHQQHNALQDSNRREMMAFYTGPLPNAQNPGPRKDEETQPAFKNQPRTIRLLVASLRIENNWMNVQAVNDLIAIGAPAV